jgi:GNAT superfamily N-acetyltransferase
MVESKMVTSAEFVIETDPIPEQIQYLEDRLYVFNSQTTGIHDGEGLAIFVRDEQGQIVAGICGHTWGACCEVKQFWIEASRRRQGLGTQLLQAVEQEARRRNCQKIVLTTHSFQAPEFYIKHGFCVIATIEDNPRGHQNIFLQKAL